MRYLPVASVIVGAVLLAACGGSVIPNGGEASATTTTPSPTSKPNATIAASMDCGREMRRFVNTLAELDSRLGVGLVFSAYSDRVGDARVAYDRLKVNDLSAECISRVGVPAEDALNRYVEAYTIWNNCIGRLGCSVDSIERKLQKKWARAETLVGKATNALDL